MGPFKATMELGVRRLCSCLVLLILRCRAIYVQTPKNATEPLYCTVYNHLVKSGGTSIKEQLVEGARLEGSRPPDGSSSASAAACHDAVHNSSIIMGYGELLRNSLTDEGRKCQWFMMMRHPIDQLISAFYYCPKHDVQRRPKELCGEYQGSDLPIEKRLVMFAKAHWTNMTYRQMLHSIFCQPWFELCPPSIARSRERRPFNLNTAEGRDTLSKIQRIMRTYTAIGIFAHWELSMKLFDATIMSPVQTWNFRVAYNRGFVSDERRALCNWAMLEPEIHHLLAADILLYNYGVFVFKDQTSKALGVVWRTADDQDLHALHYW